jgi:hypothetical protein
MIRLMAKLGLDTAEFNAGLRRAQVAVAPATKEIGNQFRQGLLSFVAAGSFISSIRAALAKATTIQRGARQSGLDTGTYQALSVVAEESGQSIDRLAEKMMDGSDAGNALKAAVEGARIELEAMGRVIDSETIGRLSETDKRFKSIKENIAVGSMKAFIGITDQITKSLMVHSGLMDVGFGAISFNKGRMGVGMNTLRSVFSGEKLAHQEVEPSTAVDSAAKLAATIGKEIVKEAKKDAAVKPERLMTGFDVSSETRVGARYGMPNPNMRSPTVLQLEELNRKVAKIEGAVSTFK